MGYIFDSFTNLLSGLGMAGRDKQTAHTYVKQIWTRDQLEASFQSDWIARKAIVIPAQDSTREWRAWQAKADQIEKLEETEDRLQLQLKLQQALIKARLYGGCCMLIGIDGNMERELDPESIEKDALKFIHVLAPHQLSVEKLVKDISSPYYGQPEFYYLRDEGDNTLGKKAAFQIKIHPSRMVRLIGLESPDALANDGWGDPLMQMINDAVSAAGTVTASVATLISEAKLDVIKIPGLTEILATGGGTSKMIKRFAEANVAKSVVNGIIMDAEEEWQRIGVDFNGMPEILQMYLQIAAGACDIPVTRFLGMSPAGLNATGESDLANYYDKIHSDQELRLSPALEKLDKAIQRSALGKFDKNIFYEWNSLWQMPDTEKATLAKMKADTAAVDASTGLIPFEALVKGRVNQLIEDGTYPGLEAGIEEAIAAMEQLPEIEGEEGDEVKMLPPPGGPSAAEGMEGQVGDSFNKEFDESMVRREKGMFAFQGGPTTKEKAAKATRALASATRKAKNVDELGPGYSKSAKVNPRTGVIHTSNVNDAVLALYQDRRVELKQPKQVATLIRTLGEATKAMVEEDPDTVPKVFDLCKVSVKGTNLFCAQNKGIPRIEMPQMDDDQTKDFIKYLKKLGFTSEKDVVKSAHLKATQTQLDTAKVNKFFERIKKDKDFKGDDKRLVISDDDYVLDGHHHWAAQIAADTIDNKLGDHKTKVFRVNAPIIPLYKLAMKFTGGKGAKGVGDSADGVWITWDDEIYFTADELIDCVGFSDAIGKWTEALHPRVPGGEHGGEFGSGGGGTMSVREKSARAASALKKKNSDDADDDYENRDDSEYEVESPSEAPKETKPELKPLSKEERTRYMALEDRLDSLTPEEKEEYNQLGERFDADWDREFKAQAKKEAEEAEARRDARHHEMVNEVCADLGFDTSRVDLSKGTHEFELNGKKRPAAGLCELSKGEAGRITMFTEHIYGDKSFIGTLAHEIEHSKFQFFLDLHRGLSQVVNADPGPEPDPTAESYPLRRGGTHAMMTPQGELREAYQQKYPTYHAMQQALVSTDEFAAGDGVSAYSAEYWKGWHAGTVTTPIAMHETLAEMARIKYETGKFPEHYGFSRVIRERGEARPPPSGEEFPPMQPNAKKGTTIWRNLYRLVDKTYKMGH